MVGLRENWEILRSGGNNLLGSGGNQNMGADFGEILMFTKIIVEGFWMIKKVK